MELKLFITVFATVFLAELGDKTQLATLLFAADKEAGKLTVFAGASLALMVSSAIGVVAGGWMAGHVDQRYLAYLAGLAFIAIGIWTILKG